MEARPNLHLILVSPVLGTPAVARRHPQQFTERPCREDPSPVRAFLTSSLQRRWGGGGWRLSWGLSSRGSVLAIRWGQDPPEEGRGQGKTQRGRYQLICSCDPGMGQGPGGHEEQGLSPHVPETALVGARRPV